MFEGVHGSFASDRQDQWTRWTSKAEQIQVGGHQNERNCASVIQLGAWRETCGLEPVVGNSSC